MAYLAHSSDEEKDVNSQLYKDHINGVMERSIKACDEMLEHYTGSDEEKKLIRMAVEKSTMYHDLGKLDSRSQEILSKKEGVYGKMINHVDAGVVLLMSDFYEGIENEVVDYSSLFAAITILGHHRGILSYREKNDESEKSFEIIRDSIGEDGGELVLRDVSRVTKRCANYTNLLDPEKGMLEKVYEFVDRTLKTMIEIHEQEMDMVVEIDRRDFDIHPDKINMMLKMIMACQVEGDFGDTSANYKEVSPQSGKDPIFKERLEKLKTTVKKLSEDSNKNGTALTIRRNIMRNRLFEESLRIDDYLNKGKRIFNIKGFVGYGKFYGALAGALKASVSLNKRRIIYVAPFNSIVTQAVEEANKAIVLDGEKPSEVVSEHCQSADYFRKAQRDRAYWKLVKMYATNWMAPVIITSAVQLYETLASNRPAKIRKMHNVPGSVIIIDESHVTAPVKYMRQIMIWLKDMVDNWGCVVILTSGTTVRFWNEKDFNSCNMEVTELITDENYSDMQTQEGDRIRYHTIKKDISVKKLIKKVFDKDGPRVVVCNTIMNAAQFAKRVEKDQGRCKVEFLSTALSPEDIAKVVEKIKIRLNDEEDNDWVLVATSMIENGINFSFRNGFRERCSLMSLIQLGGRINRNCEMQTHGNLYDFSFVMEDGITENMHFLKSEAILKRMFVEGKINPDYCTEAMLRESKESNADVKHIEKFWEKGNHQKMNDKFKIIPTVTSQVIVNQGVIEKIKDGILPHYKELSQGSVSIRTDSIEKGKMYARVIKLANDIDDTNYAKYFYLWDDKYQSDFLGYMACEFEE